ncbi:MAG TPA: DUF4852 domain-containing protein, partial [Bacteroidia bacterium]|nr:DUF4852 domain-containing protein [Bacteroidia bacterium]
MKPFLTITLFLFSFIIYAQDEATQSEVTSKGNLIYKNNVPFTGTLYSNNSANNDCKCTLEANYNNGSLNGFKREWYKNGKLRYSGKYANGKKEGEHISYESSGVIFNSFYKNDILIKDNKLHFNYSPLSNEEMLKYTLFIHKPDSYTDYFIKKYLSHFDKKYRSYKEDEFELNRKKNNARNIFNNLSNVNFNKTFKKTGSKRLKKYSFIDNNFPLYLDFKSSYLINFFSGTNMKCNGKDYQSTYHNAIRFEFINMSDFSSINLSSTNAESFKNKLNNNTYYYSYTYKVLSENIELKTNNSLIILGYITKVMLYSDSKMTNLIYTINNSNNIINSVALYKKKNSSEKSSPLKTTPIKVKIPNNKKINQTKETSKNTTKTYRRRTSTRNTNKRNRNKTNPNPSNTIIKSAEEGNVDSQYRLATMYATGNGLLKDSNKAFYWYEKSAKSGFAKSQEELAAIYYQKNDFNNAFIWYSKAANANHSRAQYILGYMYRKGIGTKKSRKKAKSWWKKSCKLGNKNSCEEVKKMNAFGNAILNS